MRKETMKKQIFVLSYRIIFLCFLLMVVSCASVPFRTPVPPEFTSQVGIAGIPNARFWADEWPKFSMERFKTFTDADFKKYFQGVYGKTQTYLAISGGGANGAFGAGLLAGWTTSGTRPEFTMVTGISTGALSAPFAFLGPDYDETLKKVYTTTSTKDILRERSFLSALFTDSMSDTEPLKKLISKYVTADIIDEIAREYKRGRRLYVGTVNLDAGRSVIWDIGAIASSTHPHKLELVHDILRASAAIPVAFPPVTISVAKNDKQYEELHVDGGTGSQVFVYPASVDWREITKKLKAKGDPAVYVIRNAFLDPNYQGITQKMLPIAGRSIDSMIRTQGIGDLYQIYALCQRDGNVFNLAYIPSEFSETPEEGFDTIYMGKLYEFGYQMAKKGYPWAKAPPGFILEK
jgi:predicted patatin/cPLA2 family phospholipase